MLFNPPITIANLKKNLTKSNRNTRREHISNFTSAYTDVTCGNVGELTDVTVQLAHKALAETHDLAVGLALGVKVRAALAAAHGQGGKGVFQNLLETEELDNGEVNGGMETNTALVRTDSRVKLHSVTTINLNFTAIIEPAYS